MDAKCPECFGKKTGCKTCSGTGHIDAFFASGSLYTRACLNSNCGHENGGFIVMADMKKGPDGEPPEFPRDCIMCKSPCRWKYLGEV